MADMLTRLIYWNWQDIIDIAYVLKHLCSV